MTHQAPPANAGPDSGPANGPIISALTGLLACTDIGADPPAEPLGLLTEWYNDARDSGHYENFNAMTLATATRDGIPSARIVLCKAIEPDPPAIVFYTSYSSQKGRELDANPRAAAVFYWPHARRQARITGIVERVSEEESDAYFQSRPLLSRIGAQASSQSAPLASREQLIRAAIRAAGRAGLSGRVERPPHWGGYRIHAERIELWSSRSGRLHDRVRWTRAADGAWSATRLGS